jgi:hypothetical protein
LRFGQQHHISPEMWRYELCWSDFPAPPWVETLRKVPGKIDPELVRMDRRVWPPGGNFLLVVQPRDDSCHQSTQPLDHASGYPQSSGTFGLGHLALGKQTLAEEDGLIEVADDRQKGLAEHGKGHSRAKRHFAAVTLDPDLNPLFRVGSSIGTIAGKQGFPTDRTADTRFFVAERAR